MDSENGLNDGGDNENTPPPMVGAEIRPTTRVMPVESPKPAELNTTQPTGQPSPAVGNIGQIASQDVQPPMPSTASTGHELQPLAAQPFTTPTQPANTNNFTPPPAATSFNNPPVTPEKGKKRQKAVFVAVLIAFLLIGGSAAAYLGWYLPNQPDQVWQKALSNTAAGYDKLLAYEEGQKGLATTKLTGDYRIEANNTVFDGSYSLEADSKRSKFAFDVGYMGSRIKLNTLTEIKESSPYPDVYVRAEGIDVFEPLVQGTLYEGMPSSVNNQWYFADHSLFDQMVPRYGKEVKYSAEDVRALMKAVGEVNREYVFTTDPGKAVLENREYIGEENQDSRSTYHYKVGLNKENTKSYVNAMADKISQTELYKKLAPEGEEKLDTSSLLGDIDELDTAQTADVWVDTGTKLIRTVRFTEKDTENYLDIGLKYTGGDEFPFYLNYQGADDNGVSGNIQLTATLNTKDNSVKIDASLDTNDDGATGYVKGLLVRSNDEITFDVPADVKPITELFGGSAGTDDVLGISTPFELFSN